MNRSRRQLVSSGALLVGAAVLGRRARAQESAAPLAPAPLAPAPLAPEGASGGARRLVLHNLHTGESLDVEYLRDGRYVPEALLELEVLLRDFRTGERHAMDPALFDILHAAAARTGADPEFAVISGYRSPQTNARLHERSGGVAVRSLHLEGRAIDVRLAGVDCAVLAAAGLELARGGVGYYQRSDFVHLDTGAVRRWRG